MSAKRSSKARRNGYTKQMAEEQKACLRRALQCRAYQLIQGTCYESLTWIVPALEAWCEGRFTETGKAFLAFLDSREVAKSKASAKRAVAVQ